MTTRLIFEIRTTENSRRISRSINLDVADDAVIRGIVIRNIAGEVIYSDLYTMYGSEES